jgi:hypothetical protein
MDVVFDEVKGNVVGSGPATPNENEGAPTPKPANAERKLLEDLVRVGARRARLAAD